MFIIDKTHILEMEIAYVNKIIHTDEHIVIKIDDSIFHGLVVNRLLENNLEEYLLIGIKEAPFFYRLQHGVFEGTLTLPENKLSFISGGGTYEKQFSWLLEAEFKKHNYTILDFINQPSTVKKGLRYRLHKISDLVKLTERHTDKDVNITMKNNKRVYL